MGDNKKLILFTFVCTITGFNVNSNRYTKKKLKTELNIENIFKFPNKQTFIAGRMD